MRSDLPISGFLDATFAFLQPTLGANRVAFYRVDAQQNLYDFVRVSLPQEFGLHYSQDMLDMDPLHVRRIAHPGTSVSFLDSASRGMPLAEAQDYRHFLRHYGIADAVELIFRHGNQVRAGISVFWGEDEGSSQHLDATVLEGVHRYIEFNMDRYLLSDGDRSLLAAKALSLTPREAEITALVSHGRTNQDIAHCLSLSLATVKTHLLHIFEKTGADSRTSLSGMWLERRELG